MADNRFEAKLGLDNKEFKSKLKDSEGSVGKFAGSLKRMAATMVAAFSVTAITRFTKEVSKLAAEGEGVRQAFGNLNKTGLLDELRKATRGTASDLQLMQTAVQAANFGIPLGQLASLLEFASKRAVQTGQSVDYLVNSIVLGIGRKSIPILDNLGISSVMLKKYLGEAGAEGATILDVAKAVGGIASDEVKKMGDVAETTSVKTQRLGASWANLKEKIGDVINQSPAMQKALTIMDDLATSISNKIGMVDFSSMSKEQLAMAWEKVKAEQEDVKARLKQYNLNIDNLSFMERLFGAKRTNNKLIDDELDRYDQLKKDLIEINKLIDQRLDTEKLIAEEGKRQLVKGPSKVSKYPTLKPGKGLLSGGLPGFKMGATDQIQDYGGTPGDMIKEFSDMQQSLMDLSATFSTFFSDVNLGFQGMVDGIMTGLKRLVAELIAKSAILALLSVITGVPLSGAMFKNLLFGNFSSMIGGGTGIGGSGWKAPSTSPVSNELSGKFQIEGKDLVLALRRNMT